MLTITDINGNTEGLSGYKNLKRYRNVSGEKSLAFFVMPTSQNAHSFEMVAEESIVEFDGEPYRIKQMAEKPRGGTYVKEVVALHTFFDLIDDHKYEVRNGSLTFDAALNFVLAGTGYTYDVLDTFYAQDFDNFGDSNRLSLLQTVLQRYGAEYTLNGTHLTFRKRIGNATDFQFRYNYNVKTLARDVNTNNLSTYIKGFGKGVTSEYTSPNAAVFGVRHAKPVRDERYTTKAGLDERLKAEIIDTPEVSITVDFTDMRRAGYPYDVPNEGDDVFLIYEPMGIDMEARLMDITEEFTETSDLPIKTAVTIANLRQSVIDRWANTEKQMRDMFGSDGKVKFSVVDAAIQRATEALQSAQTELEFNNGIIAREKLDPNKLVLLNSGGIGVSTDGGNTFRTAMTGDGIVADLITVGTMLFDRLRGGTMHLGYGFDDGDLKVFADSDGNGEQELVGEIDKNGAHFPLLISEQIRGNVVNTWPHARVNVTYYVNTATGNDANDGESWATAKQNPQALIDSLPKYLNTGTLTIWIRGDVMGGINLKGFFGGNVLVAGDNSDGTRPKVFGKSSAYNCFGGKFLIQGFDMHGDNSMGGLTGGESLFEAEHCSMIYVYSCKIYGNNLVTHGFTFRDCSFEVGECHIYDINDRGIYATNRSRGFLMNNKGNPPIAILVGTHADVTGEGTRPAGSIVRYGNSKIGSYNTAGTDWTTDVWVVDSGEATPPAPPAATETSKTWTASTGDNYSTQGFWTSGDVKQGDYGYGNRYGLWYFGDLRATLAGKTIVKADLTFYRNSGGTYADRNAYIRTHRYAARANRPSGAPALSSSYKTAAIGVGEQITVDITSLVQNNIANGIDIGLGVYSTTGSTDYMTLGTTPTLKVRYK